MPKPSRKTSTNRPAQGTTRTAQGSSREVQVVSNRSGEQASNRSGGQVSNRSGGQVSNRSGGQVSNRSGEQVSNRSAGGQASNRSAGGQVSNRSGGQASNRRAHASSAASRAAHAKAPLSVIASSVIRRTSVSAALPVRLSSPKPPRPPTRIRTPPKGRPGTATRLVSVGDASALSGWLRERHVLRCAGEAAATPLCVLIKAGPVTGKTTLINQLMMHILTSPPVTLVPIIIRVQQLQKRLREAADAFAGAWNWVDAYLSLEYGEKTDAYHMLRMSLLCRNAIILIDGINEATSEGGIRESIERHITEVLAPQGHVLVVTSRPIGLTDARFASFHQMSLAPLSQAQQSWAIEQSIGTERAAGLRPYLQDRCPSDIETGERISTNPFMLSMVAFTFEVLADEERDMPVTIVELYDIATKSIIKRSETRQQRRPSRESTQESEESHTRVDLIRLLTSIFYQAHSASQLVITKAHLDAAARQLEGEGERLLEVLVQRVLQDELPLLNLLQAEPLQMQASHLAVQEFYCAKAICEGQSLPTPPWQFTAWWANTLKLGEEMGPAFRRNLLAGVGVTGDALSLEGQIGGHRPTALLALQQLMAQLRSLDLSNNSLGATEAQAIAEALEGNGQLQSLILDVNAMIGDDGVSAIADSLLAPQVKPGQAKPGQAKRASALQVLSLSSCGIKAEGARAIGSCLAANPSLTHLVLSRNELEDDGSVALSEGLKANTTLQLLVLRDCAIQTKGVRAIGRALRSNVGLREMDISGEHHFGDDDMRVFGSSLLQNARSNLGFIVSSIFVLQAGIESLDLSGQRLNAAYTTVLAGVLKSNESLTRLSLNRNDIRDEGAAALAESLKYNATLELLELNGCGIKTLGAKAIGKALEHNGSLTSCDLRNNRLGEDGVLEIGRSLLHSRCGRLGYLLCDALMVEEGVTSLDYSRAGITAVHMQLLAGVLKCNTMLASLDLYKQLDVESSKLLARALEANTTLSWLNLDGLDLDLLELRGTKPADALDLSNKNIGDTSGVIIAKLLETNDVLTDLQLQFNSRMGTESARALARAISVNGTLTRLDVRGLRLGAAGMHAIGEALICSSTSKLCLLACDSFTLDSDVMLYDAHSLAPSAATLLSGVLKTNTIVEMLKLDGVDLVVDYLKGYRREGAMEAVHREQFDPCKKVALVNKGLGTVAGIILARLMESNTILEELQLRNNQLGVRAAHHLARALDGNSTLKTINLAGNALCGVRFEKGVYDTSGIVAIADALQTNRVLTSLSLAGTQCDASSGIGSSGFIALAKALQTNSALTELQLQHNTNVGVEGVEAVARAIQVSSTLKTLNVSGTSLGMIGYQSLVDALRSDPALTSLNLGGNGLGVHGSRAFAEALQVNRKLLKLDMSSNSLGAEGGEALAKVLQGANSTLTKLECRSNELRAAKQVLLAMVEQRAAPLALRL